MIWYCPRCMAVDLKYNGKEPSLQKNYTFRWFQCNRCTIRFMVTDDGKEMHEVLTS